MARLPKLDLALLSLLDDLRQTGSVSTTASRMGLTQSGASRALGRLRVALDDPLFVLEGNRLEPTARCDALAEDLAECLDRARAIVRAPSFDPASAEGFLDVGMPDHLAHLFGPALLERLAGEAPGVDLVIRHFSRDWRTDLRERVVSLAFGVLRGDELNLRSRWVADDPWVVVVRRGHPVLRRRWTAARFAEGTHGVMTVSGRGDSHVDRALRARGLARRVTYRATSPLVVAMAAAHSDLRVTTTRRLAEALARDLPLVVKPLPLEAEPLALHLVWHERSHHDPRHRWARALVADVVGSGRARRRGG